MNTINKGYVYILKGNNGKYYVGSTNDLKRRLNQHDNNHTQTTKKMNGFELALSQEYDSLLVARKIEMKIKNLKRKDCIEKMINDGYIRLTV